MKEYYFTIETVNGDEIGETVLETWNPAEAIETAERLEEEGTEYIITADVFCNECISGVESLDLIDLRYMFED